MKVLDRIPSRERCAEAGWYAWDFILDQPMDDAFIRKGLSPGGCADLLAIGFFLLDWKSLSPAGTETKET